MKKQDESQKARYCVGQVGLTFMLSQSSAKSARHENLTLSISIKYMLLLFHSHFFFLLSFLTMNFSSAHI